MGTVDDVGAVIEVTPSDLPFAEHVEVTKEADSRVKRILKRAMGQTDGEEVASPTTPFKLGQNVPKKRGRPRKNPVTLEEAVKDHMSIPLADGISALLKAAVLVLSAFFIPQQLTFIVPNGEELDIMLAPLGRILERHIPSGDGAEVSPDVVDSILFAEGMALYIKRVIAQIQAMGNLQNEEEYHQRRSEGSDTSTDPRRNTYGAGNIESSYDQIPRSEPVEVNNSDALRAIENLLHKDHAGRQRLGYAPYS
jgi:hypothetical protein